MSGKYGEPWNVNANGTVTNPAGVWVFEFDKGEAEAIAHAVECVNACEGINPAAVPKMMAALERAVGELAYLASYRGATPPMELAINESRSALALAKQTEPAAPQDREDSER